MPLMVKHFACRAGSVARRCGCRAPGGRDAPDVAFLKASDRTIVRGTWTQRQRSLSSMSRALSCNSLRERSIEHQALWTLDRQRDHGKPGHTEAVEPSGEASD